MTGRAGRQGESPCWHWIRFKGWVRVRKPSQTGVVAMPSALAEQAAPVRILRRQPLCGQRGAAVSGRRPSLLDPRLQGDAWIIARHNETLALCFDCWEMAAVAGSSLDLPALNSLLQRIRQRPPRR